MSLFLLKWKRKKILKNRKKVLDKPKKSMIYYSKIREGKPTEPERKQDYDSTGN